MKTLLFSNRHLLILTIIILIVGGISALLTLPRSEDPRIRNRVAFIITRFPGASVERVESQVTEPIETHIREVDEVLEILANSRAGLSFVSVELKGEVVDIDPVMSKLRDKLKDAELQFPDGVMQPFFDDQRGAVAYTSIQGLLPPEGMDFQPAVLTRLAEELATRLRNVPGTELVRLFGEPSEEVTVTVNRDELAVLGLSAVSTAQIIAQADAKTSSGMQRSQTTNIPIEIEGAFETVDRVASVSLVQNEQKQNKRLSDLAVIQKSYQIPPHTIARIRGERGILVAARMEDGRRVDLWSKQAQDVIDEFTHEYQHSIRMVDVFNQNQYTQARLQSLTSNLVAGAAVIYFIIFFMMGWRSAILVGSALPLCVCAVLFGFNVFHISLHQMSIFGMILSLGLLIDNAIVMVDEMRKRMLKGVEPKAAIVDAFDHLSIPLLCSTLTTVFAFMPILLLSGNIGEFIGTISAGVILALLSSYVISMTIIPALTGIFNSSQNQTKPSWWNNGFSHQTLLHYYRNLLRFSLRHPLLSVLFALLIPLAGFMRIPDLGDQFFPPADRDQFYLQMWLPSGTSIQETNGVVEEIEAEILRYDGIKHIDWMIGSSFPTIYYNVLMVSDDTNHYAHANIHTVDALSVKEIIPVLQHQLNRRFPNAKIVIRQLGQGPPVFAPVQVDIIGPNLSTLKTLGEQVRKVLHTLPEVIHTFAFLEGGEPKYWLVQDEDEINTQVLPLTNIAQQMQSNLEGVISGSLVEEFEELPVRIRYDDDLRSNRNAISTMPIQTGKNREWFPLTALGTLQIRPENTAIRRKDGERFNTVRAYLDIDALPPAVTTAFQKKLADIDFVLPEGYRIQYEGDSEEQANAISNLFKYVPVLTILMIATLVLAFRSVTYAVLLGVIAAASVGISTFVVWVSGYPFGFNPMIGTAGLIGVALNDSIVVLAALHANQKALQCDVEEIVEEVVNITRHIASTTLTTIGGFLPLLLFSGGDFWPPLAVVIAGGVSGATILALFFIPPAFLLYHRTKYIHF